MHSRSRGIQSAYDVTGAVFDYSTVGLSVKHSLQVSSSGRLSGVPSGVYSGVDYLSSIFVRLL